MRTPDLVGSTVRAWRLPPSAATAPDHAACLASWHLFVPGAHPHWSWWLVSVCHLRDLPGVPPAKKRYPDAAYELLVAAIHPDDGVPDVDGKRLARLLTPFDVSEQFDGCVDAQACDLLEHLIGEIVAGRLSPDSDFRSLWRALIGRRLAHFRGEHGPGGTVQ